MSAEEGISWIEIVLSMVSSFIGGAIVAGYFHFFKKPKSKKVFEHNRELDLEEIFKQIQYIDDANVDHIFKSFKNEFGPLERGRKEVVPTLRFVDINEINKSDTQDFLKNYEDNKKITELKVGLEHNIMHIKFALKTFD